MDVESSRRPSTGMSTRVNSPVFDKPGKKFDDEIDDDDQSEYHDATRINSIDLEIAAKQANESESGTDHAKEEKEQQDLLKLDKDEDPLQWAKWRKWCITVLMGSMFMNTTAASSMATGATQEYISRFGVSMEVSTLVLSTYLIGFSLGPLCWAPLSEVYGRKLVLLVSMPVFLLFSIGCGLSQNITTLLVLRVFAGFFGACPQSTAGATIADMWSPKERLWPMFIYVLAAFLGPILGPSSGGFLYVSGNWRFIYYVLAIYAGVNTLFVILLQGETYAPVLHKRKAAKLREQGHSDLYAPMEKGQTGIYDLLRVHVSRPFVMLFTEPPLIYAAAWTGFTYGVIFLFFEAYPVVFQGIYGMNAGEEGLCFLGLGVGILSSAPLVWYFNNVSLRAAKAAGGKLVPEAKLQQVMLSAPLFVVGFFWFGWTARPEIHWIVPIIGTIPIGASLILSFNALTVYVAQCYHIYTASALGGMAFSRCFFAIFIPLFGSQMYKGLGPGWATSILGFISLAAIPVPIIFYRYGTAIRNKSERAISS